MLTEILYYFVACELSRINNEKIIKTYDFLYNVIDNYIKNALNPKIMYVEKVDDYLIIQ